VQAPRESESKVYELIEKLAVSSTDRALSRRLIQLSFPLQATEA